MDEQEFPGLLKHKSTAEVDGNLQMKFSYSPTLAHSEKFADLTGDTNPIHRELYDGETVVPGFLQSAASIITSKNAMLKRGINPIDLPISYNRLSLDNFVVSGLDYEMTLTLKDEPLEASIEITDAKGNRVFGMKRGFDGSRPPEDYRRLLHSDSFDVSGQVLPEFKNILGAVSSESNLYSMAGTSSIILNAYNVGKLPRMEEGVVPIYVGQDIYLNSDRSVSGGVDVLLKVDDVPKGELKRGDRLKTMISTWHKGNLINRIASEISFESERLPKLAVKRALRHRKRV